MRGVQTASPGISVRNLLATLPKEQPDLAAGRKEVREALAHLVSEAAKAEAEASTTPYGGRGGGEGGDGRC